MRKKRWIAPVWGMLATAAFSQAAPAQAPGSPLDGPFPPVAPPAGPGVAPGTVPYAANPTYTPIAPDAASPAGFPPGGMQPWPTISPFDNALDSTYNQNGIWFREILGHSRRYKITAEFISARYRQPGHATIGSEAAISPDGVDSGNGIGAFQIFGVKDAAVMSARGRYWEPDGLEYPDPPGAESGPLPRTPNLFFLREGTEGSGGEFPIDFTFPELKAGLLQVSNSEVPIDGSVSAEELSDTILYPVTGQVLGEEAVLRFGGDPNAVGEKRENPASPGMRLTFGLEDEDESGFEWTGSWINGQATVFRRGLDDMEDIGRSRLTNIVFFDAPQLGEGAAEVLDYNVLFQVTNETETAGTDLAFYHTPMVDYGWFRLRPMYGARYNYIRETFNFTGKDNGFSWSYDADGTPGPIGSNIVPLTFDDPATFTVINPYETSITSKTRSHLYGPQVGFDMQMGGEYVMVTGVTKAGIVANTEKLTLDSAGAGVDEALTGLRPFRSDAKTHTRVVPFLELGVNADINVFPIIPYVNRWHWLKNARVRTGYTTLIVGNVQRPIDQIVWRAESAGGPYIAEKGRDAWYSQYWNVGVHWNF